MSKNSKKSKIWKEEREFVKRTQIEHLEDCLNEATERYKRTRERLDLLKKNYLNDKERLENVLMMDDARITNLGTEINKLKMELKKIRND